MFQTDYFISGIAPFGDALVVLAFLPEEEVGKGDTTEDGGSTRRPSQRPEVRLVTWTNQVGTDG